MRGLVAASAAANGNRDGLPTVGESAQHEVVKALRAEVEGLARGVRGYQRCLWEERREAATKCTVLEKVPLPFPPLFRSYSGPLALIPSQLRGRRDDQTFVPLFCAPPYDFAQSRLDAEEAVRAECRRLHDLIDRREKTLLRRIRSGAQHQRLLLATGCWGISVVGVSAYGPPSPSLLPSFTCRLRQVKLLAPDEEALTRAEAHLRTALTALQSLYLRFRCALMQRAAVDLHARALAQLATAGPTGVRATKGERDWGRCLFVLPRWFTWTFRHLRPRY